jgi:hypothetical protein
MSLCAVAITASTVRTHDHILLSENAYTKQYITTTAVADTAATITDPHHEPQVYHKRAAVRQL